MYILLNIAINCTTDKNIMTYQQPYWPHTNNCKFNDIMLIDYLSTTYQHLKNEVNHNIQKLSYVIDKTLPHKEMRVTSKALWAGIGGPLSPGCNNMSVWIWSLNATENPLRNLIFSLSSSDSAFMSRTHFDTFSRVCKRK